MNWQLGVYLGFHCPKSEALLNYPGVDQEILNRSTE